MNRVALDPADRLFAVGVFIADPTAGRLVLRRDGTDVPLTRKAFSLLMTLVEANGAVVEKDDLLRRVWPDVVVEENNLARTVSMIRKALQAHDVDRKYIATTPGLGYYLQEPVEIIERSALPSPGVAAAPPQPTAETSPRKAPVGWLAGTTALAVVIGLIFWFASRSAETAVASNPGPTPQARLWKATTGARVESDPAWSPDGQFLAYSSERTGNFDIWIQPMKGGNPVQVTSSPERDWQPAWSPDGSQLVFRSERDGGGLYLMSAWGGAERRVSPFGRDPQWSPDGKQILFYGGQSRFASGAYVVEANGIAKPKQVLAAELAPFSQFRMAWHPDGRVSLHGPLSAGGWSFRTIGLDGRPMVASDVAASVSERLAQTSVRLGGFSWSPRGDAVYFEGQAEQAQNIWRVGVDPTTMRWVGGPDRLTTGTNRDVGLALSPDGTRLAFSSQVEQTRIWSFPFDAWDGRIVGEGEPVTPEGIDVPAATISWDGRRMAYGARRGERQELWVRHLDSRQDRLVRVESEGRLAQARMSPDGSTLVYTRDQASLVLISAETGREEVITGRDLSYTWDLSADRKHALVGCNGKAGQPRFSVCLLSVPPTVADTVPVRTVASDPAKDVFQARLSPNQKWIAFMAREGVASTVYVVPFGGGAWRAVTDSGAYHDKPQWSPDGRTLYFLSDRGGFLNLWGRRFDAETGQPSGGAFEVTRFGGTSRMIYPETATLQIGVSRNRLVLPLRETSGTVWVLENFR